MYFLSDEAALEHFELLVRSILIRPEQPAVIVLGHFAPQLQGIHGFAGPEQLHTLVAQFYDLPHVSTKGALYHDYLDNPSLSTEKYFADMVLANTAGHGVIADVLIHYLQSQICGAWSAAKGYTFGVPVFSRDSDTAEGSAVKGLFRGMGDVRKGETKNKGEGEVAPRKAAMANANLAVPPFLMNTRPDVKSGSKPYRFHEVKPYCVSANDLINPLPATLFVGSGWHVQRPKKAIVDSLTSADSYYWHAKYPKSKLRVPIKVSGGDVAAWYFTQDKTRTPSAVKCWVDNNVAGAVLINGASRADEEPGPRYVDSLFLHGRRMLTNCHPTRITVIDHFVSEGSHYVECQLQGVEGVQVTPFKLLGIFSS